MLEPSEGYRNEQGREEPCTTYGCHESVCSPSFRDIEHDRLHVHAIRRCLCRKAGQSGDLAFDESVSTEDFPSIVDTIR
jgi:hypothetical protein